MVEGFPNCLIFCFTLFILFTDCNHPQKHYFCTKYNLNKIIFCLEWFMQILSLITSRFDDDLITLQSPKMPPSLPLWMFWFVVFFVDCLQFLAGKLYNTPVPSKTIELNVNIVSRNIFDKTITPILKQLSMREAKTKWCILQRSLVFYQPNTGVT